MPDNHVMSKTRLPWRDGLFGFLVAVLVGFAVWPDPVPVREIVVTRPTNKTYSLAVDDPRLVQIRRQIDLYAPPRPTAVLGMSRWQAETAAFYAGDGLGSGDWSTFASQSASYVNSLESAYADRQSELGPPPISLGDVTAGRRSMTSLVSILAIGLVAGVFFAAWRACTCPRTIELVLPAVAPENSAMDPSAIAIPARWIRLRQPIGVTIRRVAYAGLFAAAMAAS